MSNALGDPNYDFVKLLDKVTKDLERGPAANTLAWPAPSHRRKENRCCEPKLAHDHLLPDTLAPEAVEPAIGLSGNVEPGRIDGGRDRTRT